MNNYYTGPKISQQQQGLAQPVRHDAAANAPWTRFNAYIITTTRQQEPRNGQGALDRYRLRAKMSKGMFAVTPALSGSTITMDSLRAAQKLKEFTITAR